MMMNNAGISTAKTVLNTALQPIASHLFKVSLYSLGVMLYMLWIIHPIALTIVVNINARAAIIAPKTVDKVFLAIDIPTDAKIKAMPATMTISSSDGRYNAEAYARTVGMIVLTTYRYIKINIFFPPGYFSLIMLTSKCNWSCDDLYPLLYHILIIWSINRKN